MNNDILNDAHGIPSFSQMFQSQFDGIPSTETLEALLAEQEAELARLNQMLADHPYMAPDIEGQIVQLRQQMDEATMMIETFDGMTFDGFVQMLVTSGDVIHTVDRGILNMLGDLADIFGITSILGWITGTNVFTGETLTSAERDAARFNAIIAIASLAASFTGAGLAKKAGRGFVSTLAADLGSTALGGVAGIATAGILDDLDAPPWLQGLLSTGVAFGVGYGSNQLFNSMSSGAHLGAMSEDLWLRNGGINNSDILNFANQNGLTFNQLQDIGRHLNMTPDELLRAAQNSSLDNLLGIPELNMNFLRNQTGLNTNQLNNVLSELSMTSDELAQALRGKGLGEVQDLWNSFGELGIDVSDRARLLGWQFTPDPQLYLQNQAVFNNPQFFNQQTGHINWPANQGFLNGQSTEVTLQTGTIIDRYGPNTGTFFSPEGVSFPERALPPHMTVPPNNTLNRFEVQVPFNVEMGTVAPWFNQPGMGTQILTEFSVKELIKLGWLRQLN